MPTSSPLLSLSTLSHWSRFRNQQHGNSFLYLLLIPWMISNGGVWAFQGNINVRSYYQKSSTFLPLSVVSPSISSPLLSKPISSRVTTSALSMAMERTYIMVMNTNTRAANLSPNPWACYVLSSNQHLIIIFQ
jgi:hypothetical protein